MTNKILNVQYSKYSFKNSNALPLQIIDNDLNEYLYIF